MAGASLPRVTVAAIAERDGRFLLVEESDQGRLVLNQPAGHLEIGESPLQAIRREMLEETAWHFDPLHLVGIYRYSDRAGNIGYLRFVFAGLVTAHDPHRSLDPEIHRVLWLTPDEIRCSREQHRGPQVLAALEDYLGGRRYALEMFSDL